MDEDGNIEVIVYFDKKKSFCFEFYPYLENIILGHGRKWGKSQTNTVVDTSILKYLLN